MDIHSTFLYAILSWNCCTIVSALFTVQVMKSHYTAEYGGEVTMECHFTVISETNVENINVLWKHNTDKMNSIEVVKYLNGKDVQILQDKDYRDRVKLLSHELYRGRAVLQISKVKITDAGQYVCIISSQGSDYKRINLEVQAPYKEIRTQVTDVVTVSGQALKEISCHSFGYPEAEVTWLSDRGNLSVVHNTSYTLTAERLFNVTSVIRTSDTSNRTFTCIFWNKALQNSTSLTFTLPESVSNEKHRQLIFTAVIFTVLLIAMVIIVPGLCKRLSAKKSNLYNSIHPSDIGNISTSISATGKCSGYHSEHTISDVENT